MNQTDMEKNLQADPELDAVLEQMSGEVPPMPADFHDKWVNAIRTEAKQKTSAIEEKEEKKTISVVRWTRILSVAAMFIFLVGGTILHRNSRDSLTPVLSAEKKEAANLADLDSAAWEEAAEETAGEEPDIRKKNAATMTLAAGAPQAASEAEAPETWSEAAAYDAEPALAMGAAMEEEAVYEAAEAAEEPEPMPEATAMPTAMPTAEPAAKREEAGTNEEPETAETEQPGLLQQAGEFIADMGDFLLAALPYLAVLAVPAVIAVILRRRKKNG